MIPAYIALGSNLDDPLQQLQRAIDALGAVPDSRIEQVSGVYRSAAVGPGRQPDYLNAVLRLATRLAAHTLLDVLQEIERSQGRVRTVRWGPRTIDLDLLLYGNEEISTPLLTVPHPQLLRRNFVLYPLCEISDTDLALPNGERVDPVKRQCPRGDLVKTRDRLTTNTHLPRG
jgi:2-amino-4-hydroxy-6-hydroxymethyldihydropteridine diphosphokinase